MDEYDHMYDPDKEFVLFSDFVNQRNKEIVETFSAYRKNNRLLDVGCGSGTLVSAAVQAEWDAEGLEVSRSSVELLKSQGLRVTHGDLLETNYPSDYFDVVTASEVVEHIPDPLPFVREIYRILRPGGLFWASTVNVRGINARLIGKHWSQVLPPIHWYLPSVKGMRIILRDAGFKSIKISTRGVSPFEIVHHFRRKFGVLNGDEQAPDYRDGMQLNENLSRSMPKIAFKKLINSILNITQLGDSLKVQAVK